MMFNPLFLQNNLQNSSNGNSKLTKLSNPAYLFSDIIRLLNDTSKEQNVNVSSGSIQEQGNNNFLFPLLNESTIDDSETKNPNQSEIINMVEESVLSSDSTIEIAGINDSDSLNLLPPKIDLAASLEKIFNGVQINKLSINNVELLNNLTSISSIDNDNEKNELNVSGNPLNTMENNTPALNFNLLSSAALNFNDKQQLLIKVFNSGSDKNLVSENPEITEKKFLNKEIEKIASLLFGLLTQQKTVTAESINQVISIDPAKAKTIDADNINQLDLNVKDTIINHLSSNEPLMLNITVGGEKLKIEVTSEPVQETNNNLEIPDNLSDNNFSVNTEKTNSKEVKKSIKNNILKTVTPETNKKQLKKVDLMNTEEAFLSNKDSDIKTEKLKPDKKFILKIIQENVNEHSKSINALKEMLQNMGVKEDIGIKILTPEKRNFRKNVTQLIDGLLSKDKKGIVKTNNGVPVKNKISQNILNQEITTINEITNVENKVSGELVETIDKINRKSSESKKKISNTEINSKRAVFENQNKKVVTDITETPDKNTEQEKQPDKKELLDLKPADNHTNTQNPEIIKNEKPQKIFKLFGENNITVKASNLLNEISRLFEKGESKSIIMKLKPDTLGNVKIVLDVVDKAVHANIQVNNESVKQMVQNNMNTLIQTLNSSGLQLSSFNVSLSNNENKENQSNGQKKKSSSLLFNREIPEDNDSINSKSMGYNTYDFLI